MNKGFLQPTVRGRLHELVESKKSKIQGVGLCAKQDIGEEINLHNTHINVKDYGWMNIRPNNLAIQRQTKTARLGQRVD